MVTVNSASFLTNRGYSCKGREGDFDCSRLADFGADKLILETRDETSGTNS